MKVSASDLGKRLMKFRKDKKKSQAFVKEKTGLSRPTITKIENGKGEVQPFTEFLINEMIKDYGGGLK